MKNLILISLVIILIGGVIYFASFKSKSSASASNYAAGGNLNQSSANSTDTIPDSAVNRNIDIEGANFKFSPNEIRVNKGDMVKINFTNKEGFHDFVLDEFNVKIPPINAGETATVKFTADKSGTFEYYCSIGNHRIMGMKGNLIVE